MTVGVALILFMVNTLFYGSVWFKFRDLRKQVTDLNLNAKRIWKVIEDMRKSPPEGGDTNDNDQR